VETTGEGRILKQYKEETNQYLLRTLTSNSSNVGNVEITIEEKDNTIEFSANVASGAGISGDFTWTDHVGTPHTLTFTDGILTNAAVNNVAVTTWTISTLD
jgi:hypothetical protein